MRECIVIGCNGLFFIFVIIRIIGNFMMKGRGCLKNDFNINELKIYIFVFVNEIVLYVR